MFDWLGDILSGMGDALSVVFDDLGANIVEDIWNALVEWIYNTIFDAVADLFTNMNNMGAEIFSLSWVNAVVRLFTLFGWSLFAVGVVGAVFETAIEAQTGRTSIRGTALNVLKGFFACALIGPLPVELYKFCVSLQNTFAGDLTRIFSSAQGSTIGEIAAFILRTVFTMSEPATSVLKMLFFLLAFSYCAIKIFFANIKRGGILLIQIAVGSLYMFSVPRGYTDGFNQWCRQIIAICLTAFLQVRAGPRRAQFIHSRRLCIELNPCLAAGFWLFNKQEFVGLVPLKQSEPLPRYLLRSLGLSRHAELLRCLQ